MLKKLVIGALLASNIVIAPVASASVNHAVFRNSLQLRAFVPVVCKTTFDADYRMNHFGYRDLGTVNEFCNSAWGYRVIIEVDGTTENAGTIYFDGRAFPVEQNQIVVTDVNGPGRLDRTLGYRAGENEISAMRIRIEPKYA